LRADLALPAGEHFDLPHLHHGQLELVEEGLLVLGKPFNHGPGGGVGEEPLSVHVVLVGKQWPSLEVASDVCL
jgi:hypothetical protein